MNNILITGANGQLGSELRLLNSKFLVSNYRCFFTTAKDLDITDFEKVKEFIRSKNIKIIINAAAYTAVDKAEEDKENADSVNHLAVKYLAQISKEHNIRLIHISTDYVFDGKNYRPYVEDDVTNPTGVYGATKLAGENAMRAINPKNSIIIRTSWVYSSFGNNFVKTMLRLGKERDALGVIFDQVGTPTYAKDLAQVILNIIGADTSVPANSTTNAVQIYNYSNEGVLSWYDFAKEIMRMANLDCKISPIETKEYPTPAKRPHYSLLNKAKIKKDFNIEIPYWKESLDECLRIMGERK
ncbi:dTDP-4-dehydrorhamnose reductase [Sulfurimonas sp. SWIR-19]|uniref:dTDP-4-dehydrorhamnose reductase n=1 Tax=Sulfurimonas sp. SWIR-19 TaxID=2878390 RepID=UPI001CF3D49C|nr:dTDP-4-dehydrorhamnose reductase [Sulfurimonas sp. SWIR-19]UCN00579.1 dTDP-4-dehydrorhamnose reductase [Sulfurimonas sp. SWIR-19]